MTDRPAPLNSMPFDGRRRTVSATSNAARTASSSGTSPRRQLITDLVSVNAVGSLREALSSLDADRGYLKMGGVFTDDMIDAYIELKMADVERMEMTPHPVEFDMYYSV